MRSKPKTLFESQQVAMPIAKLLAHMGEQNMSGCVLLAPTGTQLHVLNGKLSAVEGFEPLGQILLSNGTINEDMLSEALRENQLLGQSLLTQGILSETLLQEALQAQARIGLSYVLRVPPASYTLYEPFPLPDLSAALPLKGDVLNSLDLAHDLPLSQAFRLAPYTSEIKLHPKEWALLRCLNGRRTLMSAMRMSGLDAPMAEKVARRLLQRGLLQASSTLGLKLITAIRKPADSRYHPPSSIQANLFLRSLAPELSVWQVACNLRLLPENASSLLAELYRAGLIEVIKGQREMERILEEF